jgi:hypothetical protein
VPHIGSSITMSTPKKKLFAKPAWKLQQTQSDSTNVKSFVDAVKAEKKPEERDMFQRSGDTYSHILKEQQEKERRRKEKEEQKAKRRASAKSDADSGARDGSPSAKRLRISSGSTNTPSSLPTASSPITPPEVDASPKTPQIPKDSIVIDLENYESPSPRRQPITVSNSPPPTSGGAAAPTIDPIEESNDDVFEVQSKELSELTRQAREQAKRRDDPNDDSNPQIDLFIEPRIPDTDPMIIKRRYKQNFGPVREAWCKHNNIDKAMAAEVYFTWRGNRLYDVTSISSLGIKLDVEGLPVLVGADRYPHRLDKLSLVATTEDVEREEKRRVEEEGARRKAEAEAALEPKKKELGIKVILRSKQYQEVKLIVKMVSISTLLMQW